MNRKILCTFFSLLFLLAFGQGQSVLVEGRVLFGETMEPIPDYLVWVQSSVIENGSPIPVTTDESGFFRFETNVNLDPSLPLDSLFLSLETFDFCLGEARRVVFSLRPDADWQFSYQFILCRGVNPPPPPTDCEAFFAYRQTDFENLEITFTDLSFSRDSIHLYLWEFGEGEPSMEANPVRRYAEPGVYPVSLMIESDSCVSHYAMEIYVSDRSDCICTTEYQPVCVVDSTSGVQLRFSNACLARCEGYDESDFVRCEDGGGGVCECPEYYDPVCVAVGRDTLNFPNFCFAECEGYLPHEFIPCYPDTIGNCSCPAIYDPVCIFTANGDVLSFPNKCEAECAGFTDAQTVDCNGVEFCRASFFVEQPDPTGLTFIFMDNSRTLNDHIVQWRWDFGDGASAEEPAPLHTYREPGVYEVSLEIGTERGCFSQTMQSIQVGTDSLCFCPRIYDPVCVQVDSSYVFTFPNPCEAECAGFSADQFIDCDPDTGCPDVDNPVCVYKADGTLLTFENPCQAELAGYGPERWEACQSDCICPTIYDPVCVAVGQDALRFSNPCFAACEGFGSDEIFRCEPDSCVCPDVEDPVCILTANGDLLRFSNPCEAECAGFGGFPTVPCDSGCYCTDIYAPVCVVQANGSIQSFSNACYAECAGFGSDQFIDCQTNWPCDCPFEFDPVCVFSDSANTILTFPNACVAECRGYPRDAWVNCDEQACFANFVIEPDPNRPLNVTFIDSSHSAAGEIINYFWDFGDGQTSFGPQVRHVFPRAGLYEIELLITAADSCQASISRPVLVGDDTTQPGPECQAMFFFQQDTSDRSAFQFVNLSIGEIQFWRWDFGDGRTSTEANPYHRYEREGVYLVQLEAGNAFCSSTVEMLVFTAGNIVYDSECRALFLPFLEVDTNTVFFLNLSTPNSIYHWDFGDGQTSDRLHPAHTYATAGTYEVKLTVTTPNGCASSFSANIDLEALNFRGTPEYFSLTKTEEAPDLKNLTLYPNPVRDWLRLEFETDETELFELEIMNLQGAVLKTNNMRSTVGRNEKSINVNDLPPGLYFLRLQNGKGSKTIRFVRQ